MTIPDFQTLMRPVLWASPATCHLFVALLAAALVLAEEAE
jgi:hypothetical protein